MRESSSADDAKEKAKKPKAATDAVVIVADAVSQVQALRDQIGVLAKVFQERRDVFGVMPLMSRKVSSRRGLSLIARITR